MGKLQWFLNRHKVSATNFLLIATIPNKDDTIKKKTKLENQNLMKRNTVNIELLHFKKKFRLIYIFKRDPFPILYLILISKLQLVAYYII